MKQNMHIRRHWSNINIKRIGKRKGLVIVRTWDQKLDNYENDYTHYVNEENGCRRGVP